MKLIRATIKELDRLTPLFDAYRSFYEQPVDLKGAKDFLRERFEKNDSVIFMAFSNEEKALGFTQLYPSFSSVSMQRVYILNDLFVSADSRGMGVGESLMQRAKEFAIQNNCRGLTLETAVNNPAQNLYKRLGWKKDTEVNHYTWEI